MQTHVYRLELEVDEELLPDYSEENRGGRRSLPQDVTLWDPSDLSFALDEEVAVASESSMDHQMRAG